ncbi:hypothetical protein IF1G_10841 [Cordyceps javanica]|uniref:Uncharacterized protein n=1 Tax=Cordyceps javanica TaxID=43265 RepID=A0A545UM22_9HYPO|nr:hypothetical protein IF1G_10841 [Cordyceps javanica]
MHDETEGGSWTGDEGGEDYIPRCTGLDEDHTNDKPSAAMKFETTAYGQGVKDTIKNSKGCDSTKWGLGNGPITGQLGPHMPSIRTRTWLAVPNRHTPITSRGDASTSWPTSMGPFHNPPLHIDCMGGFGDGDQRQVKRLKLDQTGAGQATQPLDGQQDGFPDPWSTSQASNQEWLFPHTIMLPGSLPMSMPASLPLPHFEYSEQSR